MDKVNLADKLSLFTEHWTPKIVGDLNGQQVKVVKGQGRIRVAPPRARGRLFLALKGRLLMKLCDRMQLPR